MNARKVSSLTLVILGGFAMLVGCLDPLEGSVVILAGSVLVTLGTLLGDGGRRLLMYRILVLALIVAGVGALFGISAVGGIGGPSGRSAWWGLLILPYPVGWVMGMVSLLFGLIRTVRRRQFTTSNQAS